MFMNLICWLGIGVIAGIIASKFVNEQGDDPKMGIALAALGAVLGGFTQAMFGGGMTAFNPRSLLGCAIGAAVALLAWHLIRRFAARSTRSSRPWR